VDRLGLGPDYQQIRENRQGTKKRARVLGAFPSDQSFMRLGGSILIDMNENG